MSAVDARFRHLVCACIPIFFFMLSGWIRGSASVDPIDETGQFDDGAFPLVGFLHPIAPGADFGYSQWFAISLSRRVTDLRASRQ